MALKENDFIKISNDGRHFVHSKINERFVPIGINYFPVGSGWAPKIWINFDEDAFHRDFAKMQQMQMNIIRVFLSLKTFMPEHLKPSEEYLQKVQKFLDICASYDIRVIFSGLSAWDGTPDWADGLKSSNWTEYFTDNKTLQNLACFYEEFGRRFAHHPAYFSVDLFNEPHIVWETASRLERFKQYLKNKYQTIEKVTKKWGVILKSFDDIAIPPDDNSFNAEILWDYQLYKNEISANFSKICIDALKKHDKNHLVTVGCHQCTVPFDGAIPSRYFGFDPHVIGHLFDYISIHWYPYDESMEIPAKKENYAYCTNMLSAIIKYMNIGKPVVLEEFSLYGGGVPPKFPWRPEFPYISQQTQADWIIGTMNKNKDFCQGFLNWGWQDSPEWGDVTRYHGLFDDDGNIKEVGERWIKEVPQISEYMKNENKALPQKTIDINLKEITTNCTKAVELKLSLIHIDVEKEDYKFNVIINK